MNVVVLRGTLSSPPTERELASGDRLVTYEVTTRGEDGTATVPVAWFRPPKTAAALAPGDEVVVAGTVRRRFFRTGGATRSSTEVVADAVVAARRTARVKAIVEAAAQQLAGE